MDKESFEKLINIYDKAIHTGNFIKYYNDHINSDKEKLELELLKKSYENNDVLLTISLEHILKEIAHLEKSPIKYFKTTITLHKSNYTPPITMEDYQKLIKKNYLTQGLVHIERKTLNKNNLHIFDISFIIPLDLINLTLEENQIIDNVCIQINNDKEPTSTLIIKQGYENIPVNITLQTFEDIYYSSYSDENLKIFYQVIKNILFKENKKIKTKKLSTLDKS